MGKALSRAQGDNPEALLTYMFLILEKLKLELFNTEVRTVQYRTIQRTKIVTPYYSTSKMLAKYISPKSPTILQSGLFKNAAVCFQEETGIPARCSSREVPRTLKSVMPSFLKTDKDAGTSGQGHSQE